MRLSFRAHVVGFAMFLGAAGPALAQGTPGYWCPTSDTPAPAPVTSWSPHGWFPFLRPRPAPAPQCLPAMPAPVPTMPSKEPPDKTPPDKTPPDKTPPTPPTPPADFTQTPAAGTEAGGTAGYYGNMFGAQLASTGSAVTLPLRSIPGVLSGPGTVTFPSTAATGSELQSTVFALVPVTVSANGVSGSISKVNQMPPTTAPSSSYTTPNFGAQLTKSQAQTFLNAVSGSTISSAITSVPSRTSSAPLIGQPSPVFYAAQAAEQTVQPNAVLQQLQITATGGSTLTPAKTVVFNGIFATVIGVPFAGAPPNGIITIADPAAGGTVGRQNPSEDANPIPRDRFIFNYDYFSNVPLGNGVDVNRFQIGFEKTFFNGLASLEIRLPFAATVASDLGLANQVTRLEMGELRVTPRFLLWDEPTVHVGAGMSIYLPTGDASHLTDANGTSVVAIPDRSVALAPYFGVLYTPNARLFAQGWVSCTVDTNGDPVQVNSGAGLVDAGRLRDPANLALDGQLGYWIYKANPSQFLTGLAPFLELHYAGNLSRSEIADAGFVIPAGTINELDLTVGLTTLLGERSIVQFGLVMPLRHDDRNFGIQFGVHANFFFGPRAVTPATAVTSF
jgi:hypothetical protein